MDFHNIAVKELYQLNTEINNAEKICIFGTGLNAINTYEKLTEKGIYIDFFADRIPYCENIETLMGRPVISEDKLMEISCTVIIASAFWKEIADRLLKKGVNNLFAAPTVPDRKNQVIADKIYLLSVGDISLKKDVLYICCSHGLGDTLYVVSLMKGYKEIYPEVKKICLFVKKNHMSLASLFQGVDETIISDKMVESLSQYSLLTGTWRRRNYIYGHFTPDWLEKYDLGFYQGSMLSFYKKYVLLLPEECRAELPQFHDICQNVENISKNAIILMPYAASSKMLPEYFWENLGMKLVDLGYEVYTNVKDESERVIAGTKRMSGEVDIMAQLCEKSLAVISIRSGICDLLAMTNTVLLIINTEAVHFRFWNVKEAVRRKNIFNLNFYDSNNTNDLEKSIFQIIEKVGRK